MINVLHAQYKWVQNSRAVLFDYSEKLTKDHFITEVPGFGRGGSIRNLLVHIATTYQYWISQHALSKSITFAEYSGYNRVSDCRELYISIDNLVHEFIETFKDEYEIPITSGNNGLITEASPLKVFTHVITHEFHHKGQILSISRHLGYTPVDTDIIR